MDFRLPNTPANGSGDFATIGTTINSHIIDSNLLKEDLVKETRERALSDYGLKTDAKRLSAKFNPFENKPPHICLHFSIIEHVFV
ncbi:GATOR2 complex protein Mio-like [Glossina fuscipes fuscipes]